MLARAKNYFGKTLDADIGLALRHTRISSCKVLLQYGLCSSDREISFGSRVSIKVWLF